MAINFANYANREQAYIKHTFLDKYIPALVGRIASRFDDFVYIDGFAGPWKSVAGETFNDTSFGIALKHMSDQKAFWIDRGRDVRMRAFLVEQDAVAFRQLIQAVRQFPSIEIEPLNGRMEDYATEIVAKISQKAFSFCLIDPKGFPQIEALLPLLARPNSETLVNFMFDFANRFAGTDLISALNDWLSATIGDSSSQEEIMNLVGIEREEKIEWLAAESLRVRSNYTYAPVISVDKVQQNRTLYKLIFLTRHVKGLEVFRDCQYRALKVQAEKRSMLKALARAETKSTIDLFADGEDAIPNDRSSKMMESGKQRAKDELLGALKHAGAKGRAWGDLWPPILATCVITRSILGRSANELRKEGRISAPGWPKNQQKIPKDDQLLIWIE